MSFYSVLDVGIMLEWFLFLIIWLEFPLVIVQSAALCRLFARAKSLT